MLEALEAAGAYRATSFDAPRSNEDDAGDSLADAFGGEETGFGLAEDRATLERLMAAITPREREVLRLRFVEDLTQAEIGARIGVRRCRSRASSASRSPACAPPRWRPSARRCATDRRAG